MDEIYQRKIVHGSFWPTSNITSKLSFIVEIPVFNRKFKVDTPVRYGLATILTISSNGLIVDEQIEPKCVMNESLYDTRADHKRKRDA